MANKKNILITLLIVIIIVMAAILVYIFLIRPGITGFVVQKQTEGYNIGYQRAFLDIMQQAVTSCQPIPLTFGNQTINLINIECLQQPTQ